MPVQRLPVRRGQPHECLLVAGLGGDEHGAVRRAVASVVTQAPAGGTGGGPPSSVHGEGSKRPRHRAQGDELDSLVAGNDPPELLGTDPRHHPRPQLEHLLAGMEEPGALERDVNLLLVRVLDVRVVPVVGVAVPVRRQRHHLHPPASHAQGRARSPRESVVDRLHLLERCHRHIHHDATSGNSVTA